MPTVTLPCGLAHERSAEDGGSRQPDGDRPAVASGLMRTEAISKAEFTRNLPLSDVICKS